MRKLVCFLIDDDKDDQEIFSLALEGLETVVECRTADDGYEALQILNSDSDFLPDYIFLDLNMPRINGLQCLAEIKKISRLQQIPVIIYSTSSEKRHKDDVAKLGASGFITKPSTISELTKLLSPILFDSKTLV